MDLSTKTPAEIDGALIVAINAKVQAETTRDRAHNMVERIEVTHESERRYYTAWCSPEALKAAKDEINVANATIIATGAEIGAIDAEFDRRGGWTRYFLVTNSNGHVHSSQHCSTCFPTTQYAWLTEQAGMTPEALVDLAGESACTECFPWAPVSALSRHSVLEAPERKAARLVREAEKAERLAKKIAKALTTDGSEFVVRYGPDRFDREFFKTEQAASQWVVEALANRQMYGYAIDAAKSEAIGTIVKAMVAKHGTTAGEVFAQIDKKVAAKVRRDSR